VPAVLESYSPPDLDLEDVDAALRHKSDADLRAANFVLWTIRRPAMLKTGRLLARVGLALRIPGTVSALRGTVFRQFCGGTNLEEALDNAERLHQLGVGSILDYAAEGGSHEESGQLKSTRRVEDGHGAGLRKA